jgi:hypothetical protein
MTVDSTLAERGARYRDFREHAYISEALIQIMMYPMGNEMEPIRAGWSRMDHYQRQALRTIAYKIARILNGDPNYADNWHDIQGYAKLVEDRLPKPPTES